MREDERRPVDRLDHLRHRERLPRSGGAEEHLVLRAGMDALRELPDRLRLVALRLERGDELEVHYFFLGGAGFRTSRIFASN